MNIYPSFWKNASSKRKRIYCIILVFIIAILLTVGGALVPLSYQDSKEIADSLNQTLAENTASGSLAPAIFVNNFSLCLLMFIPLVGALIGFFILFNSGIAIGAIARVQTSSAAPAAAAANIDLTTAILVLAVGALVFLLEFVSYSIGISESIWLFRRLTQRRWRELKATAILVGIVALLLGIGAVVETLLVSTSL
jgi:hypothetical protein